MRRALRSLALPVLVLSLTAAACGDDPDPVTSPPATTTAAPAPTTEPAGTPTPVAFTDGTAHVEISGDENVTIDFEQLNPDNFNQYDPEDGEADVEYLGGDDGFLRLTLTFDQAGQLADAFVAIGLGGRFAGDENYYYDAFHSQCDVTATFDGTGVSGEFTCDDLPEDSGATIDATGTFEASA